MAIWVKDSIEFMQINSPFKAKKMETIAFHVPRLKADIVNVYRGFDAIHEATTDITMFVDSRKREKGLKNTFKVGKFNVDLRKWGEQADTLTSVTSELGFMQLISSATRIASDSSTCIDYVYTKSKKTLRTFSIPADISDHNVIMAIIDDDKVDNKPITITKRWIASEDYDNIRLFLKEENWKCMVDMSTEKATTFLIEKIQETLDILCPVESKEFNAKPTNQLVTRGIKTSLIKADSMYRNIKKGSAVYEYKKYKKILDNVCRESKIRFYNNRLQQAGTNGREIWSIINEVSDKKRCKHKMPGTFKDNGKTITGEKEIAEGFNKYFASIGTDMANSLPTVDGYKEYLRPNTHSLFHLQAVRREEVAKIMKNQKPKLSCGLDTINKKLVKICHEELSEPKTIIINKSMESNYVPSLFEIARIIPLYKKNSADEFGNYRPVSLYRLFPRS